MRTDRRIDPDYNPQSEQLGDELKQLIAQAIAERANVEVINGDALPKWAVRVIGWLAGGFMALTVSGIVGAIVAYGKIEALDAKMDYIMRAVEPHFRGAPNGNP